MRLNELPTASASIQLRLKEALARRAMGVAVVSVRDGVGVRAATVGSFIGVSVEPPLVAFTCARSSRTLALLPPRALAGIVLLGEHQEAIARACADPARGPVDARHLELDAWGTPVIAGGAARFALRIAGHQPAGDHVLLLAEVLGAEAGRAPPLLYHHRRYHRLASP